MKSELACSDVITAEVLPALRMAMLGYAAKPSFSETLRAICREVVAAIDSVVDEDEATHAAFKEAMEKFVRVAHNETLLHRADVRVRPC